MIGNFDILKKRHMLPRWCSLRHSMESGEFKSSKQSRSNLLKIDGIKSALKRTERDFNRFKKNWEESKDIYFAEELLTSAVILGKKNDPSVLTAAKSIESSPHIRTGMRIFAQEVVHGLENENTEILQNEREKIFLEIRKRKKLIILNPNDGLRIAETALLYANLGQVRTAKALIERAVILLPDNRYVLRAATRFFSHIGEPDIALHWLQRSPRTDYDPWLASAQMAISAATDTMPSRWKNAILLLRDDKFSDRDKSELAAQVGTFELSGGSRKKAIKLLKLSSNDPTENSIAQIEWIRQKKYNIKAEYFISDISISHEAVANTRYLQSRWDESLQACESWQRIEPFSARPAILGSFVSSIMSNSFIRGLEIANLGLVSNPKNMTLLNNAVVLLAYQGEIEKAKEKLGKIVSKTGDNIEVSKTATEGLIEFRSGNFIEGTNFYSKAINIAMASEKFDTALRAYSFFAREMSRINSEKTKKILINMDDFINVLQEKNINIPRDVPIIREQIYKNLLSSPAAENLSVGQLKIPQLEIH